MNGSLTSPWTIYSIYEWGLFNRENQELLNGSKSSRSNSLSGITLLARRWSLERSRRRWQALHLAALWLRR
jgi:hypothetical protein